jgi:hypothetical protein
VLALIGACTLQCYEVQVVTWLEFELTVLVLCSARLMSDCVFWLQVLLFSARWPVSLLEGSQTLPR